MGYEVKVFIVKPTSNSLQTGKFDSEGVELFRGETPVYTKLYSNLVCSFELGKTDLEFKTKPAEHYIYSDDGNTPIVLDRYSKELGEMSIDDATQQLIDQFNFLHIKSPIFEYRAKLLFDTLMNLVNLHPELKVLTFGH